MQRNLKAGRHCPCLLLYKHKIYPLKPAQKPLREDLNLPQIPGKVTYPFLFIVLRIAFTEQGLQMVLSFQARRAFRARHKPAPLCACLVFGFSLAQV